MKTYLNISHTKRIYSIISMYNVWADELQYVINRNMRGANIKFASRIN